MSAGSIKKSSLPPGTHLWDDDIYELKTPVPAWWRNLYLLSVLIALLYILLYPAIPLLHDFTKGILGWTSENEFNRQLDAANKRKSLYFDQIKKLSLEELFSFEPLTPFIESAGRAVFSARCSKCHGIKGKGALGVFPDLTDNIWIHGGSLARIYKIIKKGKRNKMPAHKRKLSSEEIRQVAEYIYSLGNGDFDADMAKQGEEVFNDDDPECYFCHGDDARGDQSAGGPDLTDNIWIYGGSREKIIETITFGRVGIMPPWRERLSDEQIKIMAVYVKKLGNSNLK